MTALFVGNQAADINLYLQGTYKGLARRMKSFLCNLFNNGIAKTTCWPVGFLGKLGS
jgi:hypothetical protein